MLPSAVCHLPTPRANEPGSTSEGYGLSLIEAVTGGRKPKAKSLLPTPAASDSTGGGAAPEQEGQPHAPVDRRGPVDWGKYADAVHRWEALTRPAPAPTEPNRFGNPQLTARLIDEGADQ